MKYRKGRRLISETSSESGKDGPIVAGEFPNSFYAWLFQHFERRVPADIAINRTRWVGFTNWHDAVNWANQEPR